MTSASVPIPALEPPWPDGREIMVVSSDTASPGWRRLAHEAAAAAQPGGHSFPLAEGPPGSDGSYPRRAFLYRRADHVCGYLCLADKLVTGYRGASTGYRGTVAAERVIRPCVLVVWTAIELRRRGIARHLVTAAAQYSGVPLSGLAWAEPFTDSGYWLARSVAPDGMWIADYS